MLELETLARPIQMVGDCSRGDCLEFAVKLHTSVRHRRYQVGASIMDNPRSVLDWRAQHRTARKRADRCHRFGYRFAKVDYSLYDDDIYEINTSMMERQGRPMSDGYLHFVKHGRLPDYPCVHHRTITYGVLAPDEHLCAYMTLHRSGELGMVSMILGHGDHWLNDIMYALFAGMVHDQSGSGGILYYNRHDSGTEGLRFFKERLGFREGKIEWIL